MNEIKTNRLVIVDDEGKPRIILDVGADGAPLLSLRDSLGLDRIKLQVVEGERTEAVVQLLGTPRGPTATLYASSDGGTGLELTRHDRQPLLQLDIEGGSDARPSLTLFNPAERVDADEQGRPLWAPTPLFWVTVTEGGVAYLQFLDETGKDVERLP